MSTHLFQLSRRIKCIISKAIFFVMVITVSSCAESSSTNVKSKEDLAKAERDRPTDSTMPGKTGSTTTSSKNNNGGCDEGLWKYVYNADRLQVLEKCKTVTGVIDETNADEDGDQHMLLKLDPGQESLLTERNMKKKQGDLVIEAVCINNITRKKAMGACDGYVNNVQLPNVGDHVTVVGSLVIDSHNGWAEIHPITQVTKK